MTIRTQYPYQTLSVRRGGSEEPAFNLWAAYVPWDREQRSHISVGMLMIEKPRIPGLVHVVWPLIRRFAESVFAEDRMAVEMEQRAYDEQGGDWNQEVNPVIVSLRALLVRRGVPLAHSGTRGASPRTREIGVIEEEIDEMAAVRDDGRLRLSLPERAET
jgi:hypothetical protein